MGTRRMFTREFKLEAVKLVSERGVRVAQAARDLGIGENVLGRWVREAASGKGSAFPGRGVMKAEDAELAQLRKELARTKAERDISELLNRGVLRRSEASGRSTSYELAPLE